VDLSLNEGFDSYGRLIQMVGGNINQSLDPANPFFGIPYITDPGTPGAAQIVHAGETQVWRIANLTGDTHPMHIHLVNWQIISRQIFDPTAYPSIDSIQPSRGPDLNEQGWKETVRMNPGEVITAVAKFDLPNMKVYKHNPQGKSGGKSVVQIPESPRLKAYGIPKANEYVWHCHILEHEEHDMMHALVVV
jgi:spore coat protein A, manganese oxidase